MSDVESLFAAWRGDPVAFAEHCTDPETGNRFCLYEEQRTFLRAAFTLTSEGRLPYSELVFSAGKKSGKTTLGALSALYVVLVLVGRHGRGYICANDENQAIGRMFEMARRIVEATSELAEIADIQRATIAFPALDAKIEALSMDPVGNAGTNGHIVVFDELWGYTTRKAELLWAEMVPPPTRQITCRLTTTYAGVEGEAKLLWELWQRGKAGTEIAPDLYASEGMLMFWTHRLCAPWQTEAWRLSMLRGRRSDYLRHVENRWVSGTEGFIDIAWWDRAAEGGRPVVADKTLAVVLGIDAATTRDNAALVAVHYDHKERLLRQVNHVIFKPLPGQELNLENSLERAALDYAKRYRVTAVMFDPYQFKRSAQTLAAAGLPMREFTQTVSNLVRMTNNLFELLKGNNFQAYPDDEIRLAVQQAVAVPTVNPAGWRIAKEKAAHKIDVVVAIAMAALGAVEQPAPQPTGIMLPDGLSRPSLWRDPGPWESVRGI